jgi:four helix bundle protein
VVGGERSRRRIRSFEDLEVYQLAFALHLEVSALTLGFPHYEMYELGSQLRRSSNSIAANIAEGWNDRHRNMYLQGINRAIGELRETRHHLSVAYRKHHLSVDLYQNLDKRYGQCGRMLRALERALEKSVSQRGRAQ